MSEYTYVEKLFLDQLTGGRSSIAPVVNHLRTVIVKMSDFVYFV